MNDNVRKIFDILGVEPYERFKIRSFTNKTYYINEELMVFLEEEENVSLNIIRFLLSGVYEIVKMPRIKKLRDLTAEEYKKWEINVCVDNNHKCSDCIFDNVRCNSCIKYCWIYHKDLYSDKFLDQEIEVE